MFYNAQCGILCMIKFNTTQEAPKYTLDDHPCGTRNNEGITVCVVRNVDDYGCCWQQREKKHVYIGSSESFKKTQKDDEKIDKIYLTSSPASAALSFSLLTCFDLSTTITQFSLPKLLYVWIISLFDLLFKIISIEAN